VTSPSQDISNISVATILGGIGTIAIAVAIFVFTSWISHVQSSLAEGKEDHHSHTQRLTTLEANYKHIIQGLGRIETSTKATEKKVDKLKEGQTELREKVRALPQVPR